jgi:hypothetical protein
VRHRLTMRFAPPRATRAPVYTAPKECRRVVALMESSGAWLMSVRAGAASRTSERYLKSNRPPGMLRLLTRVDRNA